MADTGLYALFTSLRGDLFSMDMGAVDLGGVYMVLRYMRMLFVNLMFWALVAGVFGPPLRLVFAIATAIIQFCAMFRNMVTESWRFATNTLDKWSPAAAPAPHLRATPPTFKYVGEKQ